MAAIRFNQEGDFSKLTNYLNKAKESARTKILDEYGKMGVEALSAATPYDTGLTSQSWYYEIQNGDTESSITFCNSNINNGVSIAIMLQYGHGTRNGGWVEGSDYINPAIQPIFQAIADKAWKEVTSV